MSSENSSLIKGRQENNSDSPRLKPDPDSSVFVLTRQGVIVGGVRMEEDRTRDIEDLDYMRVADVVDDLMTELGADEHHLIGIEDYIEFCETGRFPELETVTGILPRNELKIISDNFFNESE